MDFGATLSRAFRITWNHKELWILGFLAALGSGGVNLFRGANFNYRIGSQETDTLMANSGLILAGASVFACLMLILGLVLFVVSIIARGGLITGVQQIETQDGTTFGQSWTAGVSRFWTLLGLNIIVYLPLILLIIILAILFGGAIAGIITASSGASQSRPNADAIIGLLGGGIVVLCCLGCVAFIYAILAMAIQVFGERAIMLQNAGVMDGIRRAWGIFRANLGNIILLAIVMAVISFIIGLIVGAVMLAVLAPTLFPLIIELSQSGVVSVAHAIIAMVGIVIGIILAAIVNTLYVIFNSATWTLAYLQFAGMASVPPSASPAPPAVPAA